MMIYVPFSDFLQCAKCFDNRTLKRQCVSILRLLKHYRRNSHYYNLPRPAGNTALTCTAAMWVDTKQALVQYGMTLAQESLNRGANNAMLLWIASFRDRSPVYLPNWLGWEALHCSHRSELLKIGERQRIQTGLQSMINNCRRRLGSQYQVLTVHDWLRDNFLEPLRNLDSCDLDCLRHRLNQEFHIRLARNHYRMGGFTGSLIQTLVWPYQRVGPREPSGRDTSAAGGTTRLTPHGMPPLSPRYLDSSGVVDPPFAEPVRARRAYSRVPVRESPSSYSEDERNLEYREQASIAASEWDRIVS